MLTTCQSIVGTPLTPVARQQVVLPARRTGFGLTRASGLARFAYFTANWAFVVKGKAAVGFSEDLRAAPSPAFDCLQHRSPRLLPQHSLPLHWVMEGQLPTQVDPAWLTLKFWMPKVHQAGIDAVVAQARGRDTARLQRLKPPAAS